MSDEDPLVNGQPLSSLRVVDLREELERHGLSKAGNKKDLAERLKEFILNGTREEASPTKDKTPASSAQSSPVKSPENPLVAQYKAKQQAALKEAAIEKERVRQESESAEQRFEGGSDDLKEKEATEAEEVKEEKEAPVPEEKEKEEALVPEEKEENEASPQPKEEEPDVKQQDAKNEDVEDEEEKVVEEQPENVAEEENAATEDSSNDTVSSTDASEKHEDTTEAESPAAKEASRSPSPKKSEDVPKVAAPEPKQVDSMDGVEGVELDYGEAEVEAEEAAIEEEPKDDEKKDEVMEEESSVKRKRRISIEAPKDEGQVEAKKNRQISPSRYPKSDIIHVRGLMRPFTIPLLKAEICKSGGEIVDFWIDNIRSHCYAKMGSAEQATTVRDALHGSNWPASNPKTLAVQFDTEENMERHKSGNAVPAPLATPASVSRTVSLDSQAEKKEKERRERPTLAPLPGRNGSLKVTVEAMVRDNTRRDEEARERHEKEGKERARELEKRIKIREDREKEEMENRKKRERSETPPHSRAIIDERKREPKDSGDRRKDDRVRKESEAEKKEEKPVKTADEFFKKTKALPAVYYLPLSEEEATARQAKKTRDRR